MEKSRYDHSVSTWLTVCSVGSRSQVIPRKLFGLSQMFSLIGEPCICTF